MKKINEAASIMGKKGGAATKEKYGRNHYVEAGRKGGLAGKKKDIPVIEVDEIKN